jgi:hypothetical protein
LPGIPQQSSLFQTRFHFCFLPFVVSNKPLAKGMLMKVAAHLSFVLSNKNQQNQTMKKLLPSLLLIAAVSSLMVACKKESLAPNDNDLTANPSAASSQRGNGGVLASQKTYKLTRKGADTLIYNRDGRLGKVMKDPANYTVYTYGINSITAKRYMSNTLWDEVYYQLDPGTGRALESTRKQYLTIGNINNITYSGEVYVYDATGQLTSKYNKNKPKERYTYFHQNNEGFKVDVYAADDTYKYRHSYPTTYKVINKLKLNPEKSGLDVYLTIFGTVSKYLPDGELTLDIPTMIWTSAETHKYTFNADGYPTKVVREDVLNGAAPITESFIYTVSK